MATGRGKEEEKKKELRRLESEQLQKQEHEISVAETEQRKTLSASGVLLQEAEGKLSDAVTAGNMDQISVAHVMLEIACKWMNKPQLNEDPMGETHSVEAPQALRSKRNVNKPAYDGGIVGQN